MNTRVKLLFLALVILAAEVVLIPIGLTIKAEAVERLFFILDDPHMAADKSAPVDSYELIVVQRPACGAQNSLMIRKAFVKRTASAFPFGAVL